MDEFRKTLWEPDRPQGSAIVGPGGHLWLDGTGLGLIVQCNVAQRNAKGYTACV